MRTRPVVLSSLSLLFLLAACSENHDTPLSPGSVPTAPVPSAEVAPPASSAQGRSYAAWAADWWRWALENPATGNPILDPTGAACAYHQTARAWFLAGSFGGDPVVRDCTVPVGRPILVPLINLAYFAFLSDDPATRTESFVRGQVTCIEDAVFPVVEIDGKAVREPGRYLEHSVLFDVHLPTDNLFGATESDIPALTLSPSVDAGFYLLLTPLTPGAHTLRWQARSTACGFGQDITYRLAVE